MTSKPQADLSLQEIWEEYKQKYMTPAKTPIEISAQRPSKTTSQPASEVILPPANKSVSEPAI